MIISPLAGSASSVVGGIGTAAAEAGVAVVAAVITALAIVLLAVTWRRVSLSFRGRPAMGEVTRIERTGSRARKGCIAFQAADGSQVSFRGSVSHRVRVGDHLRVRYDPAEPASATTHSPRSVGVRFLLPVGALAATGLTGLLGTFYTASAGGFGAFFNGYAAALLAMIALFSFFVAYLRYSAMSWWRGRVVATGRVDRVETAGRAARSGVFSWVSFTTEDGRQIEFREETPQATVPGSQVVVYYAPEMPDATATTIGRSRAIGAVFAATFVGAAMATGAVVLALGQVTGS